MIQITKVEKENMKSFLLYRELEQRISENENQSNGEVYFCVIDGSRILGHALAYEDDERIRIPLIIDLFILSSERKNGLGDGLLRTILNYFRIKAYEKVLLVSEESLSSFLIHENIGKIHKEDLDLSTVLVNGIEEEINYHLCDLNRFFNQECKSTKNIL